MLNVFTAYFDGCCEPINPGGTAAYGAVIFEDGQRIWEDSHVFKPKAGNERATSNNLAEYLAFNAILDYFLLHDLERKVILVRGDSKLVIRQMFPSKKGKFWRIINGIYVQQARTAKNKMKRFSNIRGQWIPRDRNDIADELSKRHLRELGVEFRLQPE